MTWIEVVDESRARGALRKAYDLVRGNRTRVDNVMRVHSLKPATMEGHYALYRSVLHQAESEIPAWFLETLGVATSLENRCAYSTAHHFEGLRKIVGDERATTIRHALESNEAPGPWSEKEARLLAYAKKLTRDPASVAESDVAALRESGATDGEILEANQVVAYFNYANRVLNGLGVSLDGDELGESPRT